MHTNAGLVRAAGTQGVASSSEHSIQLEAFKKKKFFSFSFLYKKTKPKIPEKCKNLMEKNENLEKGGRRQEAEGAPLPAAVGCVGL